MNELSIEATRRVLGEVVDRARLAHDPTMITRQGKPAAVVVGAEWYESATAGLRQFKPEPMSQRCRDGLHCGTGDDKCINCRCLCHWSETGGKW